MSTPQTTPTEQQENIIFDENLTIAQNIIGSADHPEYVRLNNKQFKLVLKLMVDTDLYINDNFQTILIVIFSDESELYHILAEDDN